MLRSGHLKSVLAGGACALALATAAAAQVRSVDVPAGDLAPALDAYIRQSGVQLVYKVADVRGARTEGVKGAMDPELALAMLLEGTDLTVFRDPSGALAIAQAGEGGGSPQSPGADASVEALIVTAQKKEEQIQDVPIAISAFTQKSLDAQKIEGGFDLLKAIPNVTFSKNNFTGYNFSIRGIGTKAISPTTDPGVAVEFNETPLIRNRLFEQEYYDLERVEVLRGPQGTLHGRNATSGVINVISAKPRLDEIEGSIELEGGNYNAQRAVGMLNIPVVQGVLGVRLAGALTKRDGYGLNLYDNSDADGRDLWSTRLTIGFEPNDRIRADLIWEHFEEDDDRQRTGKQLCTHDPGRTSVGGVAIIGDNVGIVSQEHAESKFSQGCLPGSLYDDAAFGTPNGFAIPFVNALASNGFGAYGFDPDNRLRNAIQFGVDPYGNTTQSRDLRAFYSQIPTIYRANADIWELNVRFEITDSLDVISQTAYNEDTYYASQDYNRYTTLPAFTDSSDLTGSFRDLTPGGIFCDPQLGCSNTIVGQDLSQAESTQFSQEFRIQSSFDGPVNFSLGANYTKYETVEDYYVFFNGITMAAIVALNAGGFGSKAPDRVSLNPDCTYYPMTPPAAAFICVPIETNPISEIEDWGHNYFLSRNPYELESKAIFGEIYWDATDALKFTAGLRYTDDEKTFTPIPSQTALTPKDSPGVAANPRIPTPPEVLRGFAFVGSGFGYPVEPDIILGWQEVTGRLGFDWRPDLSLTNETMIYAFVSRGYKGGGMNPPSVGLNYEDAAAYGIVYTPAAPRIFAPEFVNAFEVGVKNTLLDGALILNGGAFYYDYEGYQVSKIVDRSAQNENFDATIWGLELESIFSPTRNLRFNANFGYLNTRLADGSLSIDLMNRTAGRDDWVLVKPALTLMSNCIIPLEVAMKIGPSNYPEAFAAACPGGSTLGNDYRGLGGFSRTLPGGGTYDPADHPEANYGAGFFTDVSGNELPNAPHWTANLGAQYRMALPNGWDATLRGDFYWQSQSFHRVYNTQYDKLRAWTNTNVSLWFENADWGVKAEVYVKNVFDETPITDAFLNSDDSALTTNIFTLDPRLIGVSIRKDF